MNELILLNKEKAAEIVKQAETEIIANSQSATFNEIVRAVCGVIKCKIMLYEPEQPES